MMKLSLFHLFRGTLLNLLVGTTLVLAAGTSAFAQSRLELAPEYFYWREDFAGGKILDESGFRIGLEYSYKQLKEEGWLWAARAKLYYGSVDYDGALMTPTGDTTPFTSTTDYYGGLFEGQFGYRRGWGQSHYLDVMGGFGLDMWLRSLGSQFGYDEFWLPFYFKAGVDVSPKETGWLGAIGIKVPVYTTQIVNLDRFDAGTVTLNPKTMPSAYAQAGYQFTRHFSLVAFFDSYWFGESDVSSGFFQPESKSYQAGAKIGWRF